MLRESHVPLLEKNNKGGVVGWRKKIVHQEIVAEPPAEADEESSGSAGLDTVEELDKEAPVKHAATAAHATAGASAGPGGCNRCCAAPARLGGQPLHSASRQGRFRRISLLQ